MTDSVTSNGLSEFIGKLGGRHFRFRRGYKNVINKGIELNKQGTDCQLMMETRHVLVPYLLALCHSVSAHNQYSVYAPLLHTKHGLLAHMRASLSWYYMLYAKAVD